jgi:hypothetical protein
MPGWKNETGTFNCDLEKIICHTSCKTCGGKRQNQCFTCYDGAYLSQFSVIDTTPAGFCLPCHEDCTTCNGGADTNCLGCKDRKKQVIVSGGSECHCCHPSCLTCSVGGGTNASCTTCSPNSTWEEVANGSGYCKCNNGTYRHPYSFECVKVCPFNTEPNTTVNECVDSSYTAKFAVIDNDFTFHKLG